MSEVPDAELLPFLVAWCLYLNCKDLCGIRHEERSDGKVWFVVKGAQPGLDACVKKLISQVEEAMNFWDTNKRIGCSSFVSSGLVVFHILGTSAKRSGPKGSDLSKMCNLAPIGIMEKKMMQEGIVYSLTVRHASALHPSAARFPKKD